MKVHNRSSHTALSNEDKEICHIMAKILNITNQQAINHLELFSNINPYVKKILSYIAKIRTTRMYDNVLLTLQYVLYFNKAFRG